MKNFIDNVFTYGFAFNFHAKGVAVSLLTNKTARVIVTASVPSWVYTILYSLFKSIWKNFVFRYCGIKTTSVILLGAVDKISEEQFKAKLEEVKALVL